MYHICFVRDDEIVGYLGYEGVCDEVLREKKEEALVMHDLKSASKKARSFLTQILPCRLKGIAPAALLMFHFVFDYYTIDLKNKEVVAKFPKKLQIKVISAATGGATETYLYEPK
jgi:hypothetical protein